jgi:hypothetical protein
MGGWSSDGTVSWVLWGACLRGGRTLLVGTIRERQLNRLAGSWASGNWYPVTPVVSRFGPPASFSSTALLVTGMDATLVTAHPDKEGAAPTWKSLTGYEKETQPRVA